MFGSDDDVDFIPGNNSKLATIFSGAKSDGDNASFTFAAPKQPKKGILRGIGKAKSDIVKGSETNAEASKKLSIIIVRAVHVFHLVDGKYAPQGKLGAAVLGNPLRSIYQLLLYKGRQQHICSTRITPEFAFTVQPNSYGSFYDEQGQNWSLHFDTITDCEEFAKEIVLARAASQGVADTVLRLIFQDISVPNEPENDVIATEGDTVEIFYSVHTYATGKRGMLVETNRTAHKPQRVNIRKLVWEEGLIGVTSGVKRIVMLPPDIVGPWKKEVAEGTSLMVEVEIGRLKQAMASGHSTPSKLSLRSTSPGLPSVVDSADSTVESSADDSIRARGASISQALTGSPRTNKANLISRMAKMGQATLPLRGAITCHPSDSEETGDESSLKQGKSSVKPGKARGTKIRPIPLQRASSPEAAPSVPPHQLVVYQSVPVPWQQQTMMDGNNAGTRTYHGADGRSFVIPPPSSTSLPVFSSLSTSDSIGSPPSAAPSELSIFLSEARTHNAEVRMAVGKVGDKVEQLLGKLDTVQSRGDPVFMDNSSLLATIQKIIRDNEQTKMELEDKRNKLEMQNERVYELLNTKQKYMEQGSQAPVIANLNAENTKLSGELATLREKANSLLHKHETSQCMWEKQISDLKGIIQKLQKELVGRTASNTDFDQKLNEIKALQGFLLEMQSGKEDAEKKLAATKLELQVVKTEKATSQIASVEAQSELPKKQDHSNEEYAANKVKSVMNAVWRALQTQFVDGSAYEGEAIRKILMQTIREITIQHVNNAAVKLAGSPPTSPKKFKKTRTPSPTHELRPASPGPKDGKASSPPPAQVRTKDLMNAKQGNPEKPKPTERKIPVAELSTPKAKVTTAQEKKSKGSHEKEEDTLNTKNFKPEKDLVESNATAMLESSQMRTPPRSPKQSPGVNRKLQKPNEIKNDHEHPKGKGKFDADGKQAQKAVLSTGSEDVEGWRPQPPPLFDSEDDDDKWLEQA